MAKSLIKPGLPTCGDQNPGHPSDHLLSYLVIDIFPIYSLHFPHVRLQYLCFCEENISGRNIIAFKTLGVRHLPEVLLPPKIF